MLLVAINFQKHNANGLQQYKILLAHIIANPKGGQVSGLPNAGE